MGEIYTIYTIWDIADGRIYIRRNADNSARGRRDLSIHPLITRAAAIGRLRDARLPCLMEPIRRIGRKVYIPITSNDRYGRVGSLPALTRQCVILPRESGLRPTLRPRILTP